MLNDNIIKNDNTSYLYENISFMSANSSYETEYISLFHKKNYFIINLFNILNIKLVVRFYIFLKYIYKKVLL